MNCPLCDSPLDDQGLCPNCDQHPSPIQEPILSPDYDLPAPEEASEEPVLPGIYYDKLEEIWDETEEAEEEACRPKKEPFFTRGEKRAIGACVLILIAFIGMIALFSTSYDPTTEAISGRNGISIDNRSFSIYCHSAIKQLSSQTETLPYDAARPLNRQYYNLDASITWEDYFMAQAFSTATLTEVLIRAADAEGFAMTEQEEQALKQELETLERSGKAAYGDMDRFTARSFGGGVTWDTYCKYRHDSALAQAYSDFKFTSLNFSEEELSAYYDENSTTYAGLPKDIPNADIRHILFVPEAATTEADAMALMNALDTYAQCTSGGEEQVESIFLQLVPEYSQDSASKDSGGLLENVAPGMLSSAISSWCFDPNGRTPGDITVLPSTYGYHVLYFVGYRDNYQWKDTVLNDMRTAALRKEFSLLMEEADCSLTRFAAIDWPLATEVTP